MCYQVRHVVVMYRYFYNNTVVDICYATKVPPKIGPPRLSMAILVAFRTKCGFHHR